MSTTIQQETRELNTDDLEPLCHLFAPWDRHIGKALCGAPDRKIYASHKLSECTHARCVVCWTIKEEMGYGTN